MPSRQTSQREAIRAAFESTDRPLGPREVLALARERIPALSLGTVYRNINLLLDEQWLAPVVLPGQPAATKPRANTTITTSTAEVAAGSLKLKAAPVTLSA